MEYFNKLRTKKGKEKLQADEAPKSPVLDDEDERFLERLASLSAEPDAPPPVQLDGPTVILDNGAKVQGKNAQEALMDGADKVPLPTSPPEVGEKNLDSTVKENEKPKAERRKSVGSFFQGIFAKSKEKEVAKEKDKKDKKQHKKDKDATANTLQSAAETVKAQKEEQTEKENEDLTSILDQLNLAAVNNRVFSFSKESQELLDKFKLVLKDIVNGVPTAYNDLEKLLTDSETQLKGMYEKLPPFMQSLVKTLPQKMAPSLGLVPELLATQADKPGFDGKQRQAAFAAADAPSGEQDKKKKSKRAKIPSLKKLISAQGAVSAMLRSILNFLKFRFPAVLAGTNVLMSLAVFILLFVFWYCHKRGRETRLENEARAAAEGTTATSEVDSALASSSSSVNSSLLEKKPAASSQDQPEPPLIIHDNKEVGDKPSAVVNDLPDVLHLPDPQSAEMPKSEGITPLNKPPTLEERK